MRIIGVDPGYDRLGLAVLEREAGHERLLHSECVLTDRAATIPDRLHALGERFTALLNEFHPTAIGIETLFFNKNQKTAIAVAEARGVIIFLARQHECRVHEFSPQEVKVAVTGYGNCDKAAVYAMLTRLVPDIPEGAHDDEYDAIGVGLTLLAHQR